MHRWVFVILAFGAATPATAQVADSPLHANENAAYIYVVGVDGNVTSESFVMPCHNPGGDPERGHVAEYWHNKNTGFRGTLLWEWDPAAQFPMWRQYFGSTTFDEDEFTAWCFTDVVVPSDVLSNGVPESGLSATKGDSLYYKLLVPERASGLKFSISGTVGDADLYVKYGEAPNDNVYDCRPYTTSSAESCWIPGAKSGWYYARIKAYRDFSGLTLVGSYKLFRNNGSYVIQDYTTANSPITVSGLPGNAPKDLSVAVDIRHTYQGNLRVDLVAPDGTLFNLRNRTGGSANDIVATFSVDASAKPANGVWKLRVNDNAAGDTGTLRSWNLKF